MIRLLIVIALSSLSLAPLALAQSSNLLTNGDFSAGDGTRINGWFWQVPADVVKNLGEDAKHIDHSIEPDDVGNPCLGISITAPVKAHVWVQQEVPALPGATYQLKTRLTGSITEVGVSDYLAADVLIYFLDKNNHWLGYESASGKVRFQFTRDWQTLSIKVTTPDDVAKIGVRLGVDTFCAVKVRFDDAVLTKVD